MQCWKVFCCKKAIIHAYIEFEKFGIQILKTCEWKILPIVLALLKIIADVLNFYEKKNSYISVAMSSAKFIMITLEDNDCKGVVELKRHFSKAWNIFTEGMFDNISIPSKKPATCGCNSAISMILKMGFFHEKKLIRRSYCWFIYISMNQNNSKQKSKKERISYGRFTWRSCW